MERFYVLSLYFAFAASQSCPSPIAFSGSMQAQHIDMKTKKPAKGLPDCLKAQCNINDINNDCNIGCGAAYDSETNMCSKIVVNCQIISWFFMSQAVSEGSDIWTTMCFPYRQMLPHPELLFLYDNVIVGTNIGTKGRFYDASENYIECIKKFKKPRKLDGVLANKPKGRTFAVVVNPEYISLLHGGKHQLQISAPFTWMTWLIINKHVMRRTSTIYVWKGMPEGFSIQFTSPTRGSYSMRKKFQLTLFTSLDEKYITKLTNMRKKYRWHHYSIVYIATGQVDFYFNGNKMEMEYQSTSKPGFVQPDYISPLSEMWDSAVAGNSKKLAYRAGAACTSFLHQAFSKEQIQQFMHRCP